MFPSCKACGFEMWKVGALFVCRRCDTAPHGGGVRWGAPKTPDTDGGMFTATFEDVR